MLSTAWRFAALPVGADFGVALEPECSWPSYGTTIRNAGMGREEQLEHVLEDQVFS